MWWLRNQLLLWQRLSACRMACAPPAMSPSGGLACGSCVVNVCLQLWVPPLLKQVVSQPCVLVLKSYIYLHVEPLIGTRIVLCVERGQIFRTLQKVKVFGITRILETTTTIFHQVVVCVRQTGHTTPAAGTSYGRRDANCALSPKSAINTGANANAIAIWHWVGQIGIGLPTKSQIRRPACFVSTINAKSRSTDTALVVTAGCSGPQDLGCKCSILHCYMSMFRHGNNSIFIYIIFFNNPLFLPN